MIAEIKKKINIGYARYLKQKRLDRFLQPGEITQAEIHSKRVSKLKGMIIRLIFLCLIGVLIFPLFLKNMQGSKINFEKNSENQGSEEVPTDTIPVMLSPDFYGQDKNNKPFNIKAKSAVSISDDKIVLINIDGKIELEDGSKVNLKSEKGNYFQKKQDLILSEGVEVNIDKGYNLITNSAYVNLKENVITGGDIVNVNGKMGKINSKGFIIKNSGNEIQFFGGVNLDAVLDEK
ncbi:MAG: LPS export ABC transporter periplasmic protein LptC [Rickettsiales bacterium]|nr:LPS export ABC transporter periplasmic protein LptC [Rickettsiales bacterium]